MALGDSYATYSELKSRLGITDDIDQTRLTEALAAASREIERHTGRVFNDAGVVSERQYDASSPSLILTDDFHTTAPVVVSSIAGTDTTISASTLRLEPRNGVVRGVTGYPSWMIKNISTSSVFPDRTSAGSFGFVKVTARWGWATVPAPIKESCLILAEEIFKLKDAPFGVANWGEYGPIRVADNKRVMILLRPYRRGTIQVA